MKKEFVIISDYNEQGQLIHYKDSDKYEVWKDYNDKGLLTYYKKCEYTID